MLLDNTFNRQIIKQYFELYKKQVSRFRRQEVITIRIKYMQTSLQSKIKQRVLDNLRIYGDEYKHAKCILSKLVVRQYQNAIQESFDFWHRKSLKAREHDTKIFKGTKFTDCKSTGDFKNDIISKFQTIKSGKNKLHNKAYDQSKLILSNTVARFVNAKLSYYLTQWRKVSKIKTKRIKMIQRIATHIDKHNLNHSLIKWKI